MGAQRPDSTCPVGTHETACLQPELDPQLLSDARWTLDEFWFVGLTETFDRDCGFLLGRPGGDEIRQEERDSSKQSKEAVSRDSTTSHRRGQRTDMQLYE